MTTNGPWSNKNITKKTFMFYIDIFIHSHRVLKSSAYESWTIVGPYYSCFLFNGLLFMLQALNLMRAWTIGYMVLGKLTGRKVYPATVLFFPTRARWPNPTIILSEMRLFFPYQSARNSKFCKSCNDIRFACMDGQQLLMFGWHSKSSGQPWSLVVMFPVIMRPF